MTKFLTQDWIDAVFAALRASDDARAALGEVELTMQQHVTGTPDGQVSYWTVFENGDVAGGMGDAPKPDVTFAMDYETATAISRAELNHQAAFMQGKLKVTGNMGKLLLNQEALQMLGPAMCSVDTDY